MSKALRERIDPELLAESDRLWVEAGELLAESERLRRDANAKADRARQVDARIRLRLQGGEG